VHTRCVSGITFIGCVRSQKLGKSNMLNVIKCKKAKGPIQDRQKQLRSPMAMSEGEEFEDTKGVIRIRKSKILKG